MKSLLVLIIPLAILACNNNKKDAAATDHNTDTAGNLPPKKDSIKQNEPIDTPYNAQSFKYDSTIYNDYVPAEIRAWLKTNLSAWTIPRPDEWDNLRFQSYKNPNSLVNYLSGDFNGDKKTDYALLLEDQQKHITAWVVQSGKQGFSAIKLEDYGKFDGHIGVGLSLVEPGTDLNHVDPDTNQPEPMVTLKFPGIQIEYFEVAASTYYWKNGKYHNVIVGD